MRLADKLSIFIAIACFVCAIFLAVEICRAESYLYIMDSDKPYAVKIIPLKGKYTLYPSEDGLCYERKGQEVCFAGRDGVAWLVGAWVRREVLIERYKFLWEVK